MNEASDKYGARLIGMRLESGLKDVGMSEEELASRIGMSVFSVRSWIRGKSRMTIDTAAAICDVLGKPLDWLARRDEQGAA